MVTKTTDDKTNDAGVKCPPGAPARLLGWLPLLLLLPLLPAVLLLPLLVTAGAA
jgi:hypothetical protein